MNSLTVYAGVGARRVIEKEGWGPKIFSTLIGASGGAKFLALAQLDNFLFGDYLQRSDHPLHLIGSSIGTWRHAALTRDDPVAALEKLQHGYIHQYYDDREKITPAIVSKVSLGILTNFMGEVIHKTPRGAERSDVSGVGLSVDNFSSLPGNRELCEHSRFHTHIVTARGRGPTASANSALQGMGLALAAMSNIVHRQAMQAWFQRVVFSTSQAGQHGFPFRDFATGDVQLTPDNTIQALHASGSIPFVLTGERDIPGAPLGQYWDGGIIDYHFDFAGFSGDGLVLYPHFRGDITPGWFDKFLPWRRAKAELLDKVVLLCPSEAYAATLPGGKIPDRRDFPKMSHDERVESWQTAVDASAALAEDFEQLISGNDPLAEVQGFS